MFVVNNYSNTMLDCIQKIENIEIFTDGKIKIVDKNNIQFVCIIDKLKNIFAQAQVLPALGVSLHHETIEALKTDTWLKLNFASEQEKNGLYFTSLLFKLEETAGINLIREYNNKYDGRCIFLNLDNTTKLQDILLL